MSNCFQKNAWINLTVLFFQFSAPANAVDTQRDCRGDVPFFGSLATKIGGLGKYAR